MTSSPHHDHDRDAALQTVMQSPHTPHSRGRIGVILLVGLIGALAGMTGGVGAQLILEPAPTSGRVTFGIGTRTPRDPSLPALAPLAAAVVDVVILPKGAPIPNRVALRERRGRGVMVTSDGWFVTTRGVLGDVDAVSRVLAIERGNIRTVDRIAFDPVSDLVFLHSTTEHAAVLPLRTRAGLSIGMGVAIPTVDDGLAFGSIRSLVARLQPGPVRSSETWETSIAFDAVHVPIAGSPLVDRDGALVGIVLNASQAIPIEVLTSALPSLFAEASVTRNVLGIHIEDLSEFGVATSPTSGVVVVPRPDGRAPDPGSPAGGRFRNGSRILSVGGEALTARRRLSELLQEYPLRATVTFRMQHGAEELAVDVPLGTTTGRVIEPPTPARGSVGVR